MTTEVAAPPGTKLERYALGEELACRDQVKTRAAVDRRSGQAVVVKSLSLRRAASWKAIELFERESAVLRQLSHPGIPAFVDAFQEDEEEGGERRLYLVQVRAPGEDLARRVSREGPLPVEEVVEIAAELLEILDYLHGFTPPVIHRDIKPSNLVRSADGRLALVDFGGVQRVLAADTGGSTVVGTAGYMAPEQLMGRAQRASDLFGVGATMVHLLTGEDPAELPREGLRVRWAEAAPVEVDERVRRVVDALLAPAAEDRPASARVALAMLMDEELPQDTVAMVSEGEHSDIVISRAPGWLSVVFPQEREPADPFMIVLGIIPFLLLAWFSGRGWCVFVNAIIVVSVVYGWILARYRRQEAELRLDLAGGVTVIQPRMWGPTRRMRAAMEEFEGLEERASSDGYALYAKLRGRRAQRIAGNLDEAEAVRVLAAVQETLDGER